MGTNEKASFRVERLDPSVTGVIDYVSRCFALRKEYQDRKFLYRGQPETKPLKPTIGRTHKYAGRTHSFSRKDEADLLHRFRRRAYPHFGREILAGEGLFIARHYGLPTRLLDWTANALYALYFASEEHEDDDGKPSDGIVWAMRQRDDVDSFALNPFKLASTRTEEKLLADSEAPRIKVVFPVFNSPRIVAQDGAFTFHTEPSTALEDYEGVEFKSEDLDILALYAFSVPAITKPQIIRELSGLGITHRIVYPDLAGIARSLWETHVLWRDNIRE